MDGCFIAYAAAAGFGRFAKFFAEYGKEGVWSFMVLIIIVLLVTVLSKGFRFLPRFYASPVL